MANSVDPGSTLFATQAAVHFLDTLVYDKTILSKYLDSYSSPNFVFFLQNILISQLSQTIAKPSKRHVSPAWTQVSLLICVVKSEPLLGALWVVKDLVLLHADAPINNFSERGSGGKLDDFENLGSNFLSMGHYFVSKIPWMGIKTSI